VQDKFKPHTIVDLATLTGAIIISLGDRFAGLFCNDDELAARLTQAGTEVGEELWRMPLDDDYDLLIKSDIADIRNTGVWKCSARSKAFAANSKHSAGFAGNSKMCFVSPCEAYAHSNKSPCCVRVGMPVEGPPR